MLLHRNSILTVGAVGLLILAGCTSPSPKTTSEASPSSPSSPASTMSASPEAAASGKYSDLHQVVARTNAAVNAGDFGKAQKEFDQFENGWSKVEDGIKDKSSETYNSIEDGMDQVQGSLKQSNKQKALGALQSLDGDINRAAKL